LTRRRESRRRRNRTLPGKEEYANSEKYELKTWDWDRGGHIRDDIRRVDALRRTCPALQERFPVFAVNLDPRAPQGAYFEVPLWQFGLADDANIEAEDLVLGRRFTWTGKVQHMWLDPKERPYMIWRLLKPQGGPRA